MLLPNKFHLHIIRSNQLSINHLTVPFLYVLTQNQIFNLKISEVDLQTKIKKFTLLKSPHVFKTARTQLELRFLKRIIVVTNFSSIKQIQMFKKILINLIKNLPFGIKLKVKQYRIMFI